MEIYTNPPRELWEDILKRPVINNAKLEKVVNEIIEKIKEEGDNALYFYNKKFDNPLQESFIVPYDELANSESAVSPELKKAIDVAYQNIYTFHASQKENVSVVEVMPGIRCWRESRAIERVGFYIPGGSAPLFSTILMLAVPAKIAGCKEIVLCTPDNKEGTLHPAILYTAHKCGITKVFKIGGAAAIAAMAYGTQTVPKVNKIFGPGNQYVTMAKTLVFKDGIAIDMPAGPSEVMIVADDNANPMFVAADILSQAEHGTDSQAIVLSQSEELLQQINIQTQKLVHTLSRSDIANEALQHSKLIRFDDKQELIDFMNQYAPEHLILSINNHAEFCKYVINAGSVFLGNFAPESAGDYASGTNHTLPTNGAAKSFSGVSLDSFIKKITFQAITPAGLKILGPDIETLAAAEGLDAHKLAVNVRLDFLDNSIKNNL
ncbi:MAG: histidinol dehydrogenase [Bacteroidales bacterium]